MALMPSVKVRTRFAPSPTGFMHVGGVRTALFAWLFARQNEGTFILRIEDTDKEREVEGSINQIIESLKWVGITWDEGPDIGGPHAPYIQSQRLDSYQKYAKMLVEKGLAYADPYTKEELDAFRAKAQEEKRPFLYREHRPENPPIWDGSQPLRLKITDIKVSKWNDLVWGDLEAGPEALDDFILIKSDGYPTYNFAHIIDDLEMDITHIFRASEFISSVPNYLALYNALGISRPQFATMPPIMGPDGKKKLGKRDGAKDILDYRKEGYLPEAILNFMAFIGWNPGDEREIMSKEELFEAFDVTKIQSGGAKFNEEKLIWTNKEYIKRVPDAVIREEIIKRLPEKDNSNPIIDKLIPIVREHIAKWSDIDAMIANNELSYYFAAPSYQSDALLCPEKLRKGSQAGLPEIKTFLEETFTRLDKVNEHEWTAENIKNALWDYATEKGRGLVLWAMRFALSGQEKSPDPFTLGQILGKPETEKRLQAAIKLLS
jgi:glutamyl-tRNA synthetase